MQHRECLECGDVFDLDSVEKKRSGGKSVHCPSCSEETTIKHVGLMDGEGKAASVQILAFETEQAAKDFKRYWFAATGMHNGKASHFANLPLEREHKFRKIAEVSPNQNHKGRM